MSISGIGRAVVTVVAAAGLVAPAAQAKDSVESKVREGADILIERQASDQAVPDSILQDARCVATVKIWKAGLVVGGQGSSGLVSCRTADGGWSAPSFFSAGGANFGLQAGVQSAEAVLVFMTDESRQALLSDSKFTIGADASFALGPVGESAGTSPGAAILAYQDTSGLYAGLTFDGTVLTPNEDRNKEAYGAGATPAKILKMPGDAAPAATKAWVNALNEEAPAKAKSTS